MGEGGGHRKSVRALTDGTENKHLSSINKKNHLSEKCRFFLHAGHFSETCPGILRVFIQNGINKSLQ